MNLDVAPLQVGVGLEAAFEVANEEAEAIFSGSPCDRAHGSMRCIERPGEHLVLVRGD